MTGAAAYKIGHSFNSTEQNRGLITITQGFVRFCTASRLSKRELAHFKKSASINNVPATQPCMSLSEQQQQQQQQLLWAGHCMPITA
jgi:hypothetical protein